jgi:hypothetical protein
MKHMAFVGVFLYRLRRLLLPKSESADPMHQLLESLCCIFNFMIRGSEFCRVLKHAIELGYRHTIDKFGCVIGHDHVIIANMWSHYAKHWRGLSAFDQPKFLANQELEMQNKVLDQGAKMSLLYDRIYMLAKGKDDSDDVLRLATELHKGTMSICDDQLSECSNRQERLSWSDHTRALDFSAELLDKIRLERGMREGRTGRCQIKFEAVAETINILRKGDDECRIRAANLSKILSLWYKGLGSRQRFRDQKQVTSAIVSQIPRLNFETEIVDPEGSLNNFRRRTCLAIRQNLVVNLGGEIKAAAETKTRQIVL